MSGISEKQSRHGYLGLLDDPPRPGPRHVPNATTTSHAARNETSDSSIQFNNSDVGRHTTATYSRDTLQLEDNRVGDGHFRAEQGHLNVHFNFAQNIPHHPHVDLMKTGSNRAVAMEQSLRPEPSRSRSGGDMSDRHISPTLPTPTSASGSAQLEFASVNPVQPSRTRVDIIARKISDIFHLYAALPEKFGRLNRISSLGSMRKDLTAQSAMLFVTVENGELISCLERTIRTQPITFCALSASSAQQSDIENIHQRLEHIHKLLIDVDNLSDDLAVKQDKITLPLRLRHEAGRSSHGRQKVSSSAAKPRGGVTKRPQKKLTRRKNDDPLLALRSTVHMLTIRMEELQNQCQRLQPPQHEDTLEITSIPEDLELTKAVAVLLCKALCQVCPNKNHIHQVLFSLATQELYCDNLGDTAVEFNLAFECGEEARTWFIVQSTVKGCGGEEMEGEDADAEKLPAPQSRPSFSHYLKDSDATGEPNARFCLQYYKQGTNDLAMALKHSDLCEHQVFYPDEERLDLVKHGQAIPLRKLLEEWYHPIRQLEMLQMVHIARMLSEAVLKFHSEDWLSCKWDMDNIFIYEIDGFLEPHLRFELWNPKSIGTFQASGPRSQQISHVLSQLGFLLGYLAVGRNTGCANYNEVQEVTGSTVYAEIFQTCCDMSRDESTLGGQMLQERFHLKVVSKLAELEELLKEA
ncbi:hypothetical protein N0V93_003105 [Gnomoniopsis smithogilvyi]|uniref:Uncharacterized protein n=1 Tax=Gnomoniopsis smithogilvyi TaxID=1191159 RepID=A0A9W8YW19_9PEZI|nr:hypothetical protein N0V93_003105 [Gnomoniopsis smithogilvyi]